MARLKSNTQVRIDPVRHAKASRTGVLAYFVIGVRAIFFLGLIPKWLAIPAMGRTQSARKCSGMFRVAFTVHEKRAYAHDDETSKRRMAPKRTCGPEATNLISAEWSYWFNSWMDVMADPTGEATAHTYGDSQMSASCRMYFPTSASSSKDDQNAGWNDQSEDDGRRQRLQGPFRRFAAHARLLRAMTCSEADGRKSRHSPGNN